MVVLDFNDSKTRKAILKIRMQANALSQPYRVAVHVAERQIDKGGISIYIIYFFGGSM